MARKGKRRSGRASKTVARLKLWLLVLLALALGFAGGFYYRELAGRRPGVVRRPPPAVTPLESLVGPLTSPKTVLRVSDPQSAQLILARLKKIAEDSRGKVVLSRVSQRPGRDRVAVTVGEAHYVLEFRWAAPPESTPVRLAVVIDDLGPDLARAREFLDLPIPVTPSILPHLAESTRIATLAAERGREFLLHLPMEPQGYPEVNPGPGAILATMDEAAVRETLAEDLRAVPGASGVNNHMGSKLTCLHAPMGWLMDELAGRGLYFLDSMTTANSVGVSAAVEGGVGWARRDVFLDNVQEEAAVGKQIEAAMSRAKEVGFAVAIGHPHPCTLRALAAWAARIRAAGIRVVPLGELVHRGNGA